jgi:hypothetical protein
MRNRAKCKLCNKIIESIYKYDDVTCECGEISISGGNEILLCAAQNFDNFLRVDDEGNEIVVTVYKDNNTKSLSKPTKDELLKILELQYQKIESLPVEMLLSSVTHADLGSLIMLLSAIFRAS